MTIKDKIINLIQYNDQIFFLNLLKKLHTIQQLPCKEIIKIIKTRRSSPTIEYKNKFLCVEYPDARYFFVLEMRHKEQIVSLYHSDFVINDYVINNIINTLYRNDQIEKMLKYLN